MKFVVLLLVFSIFVTKGSSLQCYSCNQHQIFTRDTCAEGYCGLDLITCEKNQTACYIKGWLDGYWDNYHFKRGCTDEPEELCPKLRATKYKSPYCYLCYDDKCNYMHISETKN